ncbi:MAG: DinB family protein [Bacteroidia bacterium]|nr:DinB family protein [Bacteroidia bacterium]
MTIIELLTKELEQEAQTTRKMLERIPDDKYDWQPHPKSMTVRQLATHIAELPGWVPMVLNSDELDFATSPYTPVEIANTKELMAYFEKNLDAAREQWKNTSEEQLWKSWTMRNGQDIYFTDDRAAMVRTTYSQIIHHRAQMGVFLRLLNIPIPGSYGPSADDMSF